MKKVLTVAALAALISTPVFADEAVSLLPFGLGVELSNDIYYEVDAARAMSEPSVVVEYNSAYVKIQPTINISDVEFDNLEASVGYKFDVMSFNLTPYVKAKFDSDFAYDDTSVGFTTSMRF